jgi:hypothetical protein
VAYDRQTFTAGQRRTYTFSWTVPSNAAAGAYTIRIGVFKSGWGVLYHWNGAAGSFTVT